MIATAPAPVCLVHARELADARIAVVVDQIVAEQDRERLVADRLARAQHRVTEAERLLLAHRVQAHHAARSPPSRRRASALPRSRSVCSSSYA